MSFFSRLFSMSVERQRERALDAGGASEAGRGDKIEILEFLVRYIII
jgi:isoprenylcysteine carboxyl methyltransferase (ICMT) family protein YpbQ